MVPTPAATLGVTGHRPTVGTRDNKDLLSVFAAVNLATAALYTNLLASPKNAKKATGKSKTRRMPEAFAAHRRHVGRVYPAGTHPRVVLVIDHAPWHRGKPIDEASAENRHLEFDRLPSYAKLRRIAATSGRRPDGRRPPPSRCRGARSGSRTLLDPPPTGRGAHLHPPAVADVPGQFGTGPQAAVGRLRPEGVERLRLPRGGRRAGARVPLAAVGQAARPARG